MPTFPDIPCSYGTANETQAAVLTAPFGDGYTQRAADGINNVRDVYTVIWEALDNTQIHAIRDFLRARKGSEAFDWTPPLETESRKFTCATWSVIPTGYNSSTLRAQFKEEFDL